MFKYRKAFLRNDGERYNAFLEAVSSGEKQLHADNLAPYEIVRSALDANRWGFNARLTDGEKAALNASWASLPDFCDNRNALAVVDTSGSMYCYDNALPAAVALSLGLYFGECNTGIFHNHFIEFSSRPQLIEIKGKTFAERLEYNYNNASDMTKLTTADNKAYKFTYSDTYKHRMLSATSESSGVKNSFEYDGSGNLTKTRVDKSGYAKCIEQYSEYTSNGNYLAKSYSDRGYGTTYNYDAYKGTLNSVTDANDKTTSYTYDGNTDRMKTVTSSGSTVTYTYKNNGQLTSIKSPGSSPTYNFVYDKWGNNTEVKVGNQTLVTNTYKSNNGLLEKQKYGNDFTVGHNYDSLDRETSRSYNGATKFYWTYNADGNLARYSENGNRVLTYLYDDIGRLLQVSGNDGSYVKTSYDEFDKSTDLHYKFNGQRRDVYFHYSDKDNLPLDVKFGTDSKYIVENNYDELTRLKFKTYTIPSTGSKINTSYSYVDWSSTENRTTGTVRGIDYTYVTGGLTTHDRWYTYDNVGNILTEKVWTSDDTKPLREKYTYDAKNQLVRHDSVTQNCTITYAYDAGGNITTKKIYAYTTDSLDGKAPTETINYTYGNSAWGDELTSYKGEAIEYDEIGNPELYRGWTMDWEGRQLKSAGKNGTNLSFTYDSEGIRTSKSNGTNTTKYLLNGTQILAQTTNGTTLSFFYDQQGNRVAMADSSNKFYYYIYNVQGDVIALADAATGKLVVTYTYDAWGKLVELKDNTANSVGTQNPFRYRGYYYDTETSLYYLQSRYYDPDTGRFISSDGYISGASGTTKGYNLFVYCDNDPVNKSDDNGCWPKWVKKAANAVSNAFKRVKSFIANNVNHVTRTSETTPKVGKMVDLGKALGKIGFSSTITSQDKDPALMYSYVDAGTNGTKHGVGTLYKGTGADIGISSEGFAYLNIQMTQMTDSIHAEASLGVDGVGLTIGKIDDNITNDFEIKVGWGTISLFGLGAKAVSMLGSRALAAA